LQLSETSTPTRTPSRQRSQQKCSYRIPGQTPHPLTPFDRFTLGVERAYLGTNGGRRLQLGVKPLEHRVELRGRPRSARRDRARGGEGRDAAPSYMLRCGHCHRPKPSASLGHPRKNHLSHLWLLLVTANDVHHTVRAMRQFRATTRRRATTASAQTRRRSRLVLTPSAGVSRRHRTRISGAGVPV